MFRIKRAFFLLAAILAWAEAAYSQQSRFHLQEATIDDVHRAIRSGQITCQGLVRLYLNRAKAYNGVSNILVTKDGAPFRTCLEWFARARRLNFQRKQFPFPVCSRISISMRARQLSLAGWSRPRPIRPCSSNSE